MPYYKISDTKMASPVVLYHGRPMTRDQFAACLAYRLIEATAPEEVMHGGTVGDALPRAIDLLVEHDGFIQPVLDDRTVLVPEGLIVEMACSEEEDAIDTYGEEAGRFVEILAEIAIGDLTNLPDLKRPLCLREAKVAPALKIYEAMTPEQRGVTDSAAMLGAEHGLHFVKHVLINLTKGLNPRTNQPWTLLEAAAFIDKNSAHLLKALEAQIQSEADALIENDAAHLQVVVDNAPAPETMG